MAPPRRNVSVGQNFESFQTAASDAASILVRNINTEWQKIKKYKELADAKVEEKFSCQERLRHLYENKNLTEKQLISTERRAESLKNSHAELKRSLNNLRRQEDKASRDLTAEKKMLDEKLAFYQAKWRECYESRYANKPLIQEFEKTKNALENKKEELIFLKSELHGCKADIFKAKCERCKRNAEESGFYPLESFIIRIAIIGDETRKLGNEESQLLNEIAILQQHISKKEKLAIYKAQNAMEAENTKKQFSAELGNVRESVFFKKVSDEPMKRKERENSGSMPQKIVRTKEYSLLDKFSTKKSKPIQGVVAQTLVIQKGNESIQEDTIRNRMGKLKLYTPHFSTPPEIQFKNITPHFRSKEIKSNDPLISKNCQTMYDKEAISNQKEDLEMRPIGRENSDFTAIKSSNIEASRTRFKELTNQTLQKIQKADAGQSYKSFPEENTNQSESYIPPTLQILKDKSKIKETHDYIKTKPLQFGEPLESNTIDIFLNRREKANYVVNKDDTSRTTQELFTNRENAMQFVHTSAKDILTKMPESYKKPTRFQKEISSPKVLREFYEGTKEKQSINETNFRKARGPYITKETHAISSNEINLPKSSSGPLTKNDESFESFAERNMAKATSNDEARKHEHYEAAALEIIAKHHAHRNAESRDNNKDKRFSHNEITEVTPILENGNENLEDISKHQNLQHSQSNKIRSISEKILQEHTDNMNEEMKDINKNQQSILMTSHESKNSLQPNSNFNEEPMDTNHIQGNQNIVEDNFHYKEKITEDTVHLEFDDMNIQKFSEHTIFVDMEENQPALMDLNSTVVNTDESKKYTNENELEIIQSKNIPTSTVSNVSYYKSVQTSRGFSDNPSNNQLPNSASTNGPITNPSEVIQDLRDDHIKTSLGQYTTNIQGVSTTILANPTEGVDQINEVYMQEIEEPAPTHESQLGNQQSTFQSNAQEAEAISSIMYHEALNSGNSELIENGVVQNGTDEAGIYPDSSKSTISSGAQYYSPELDGLTNKLQPSFHSPFPEAPKTPVPEEVHTAISPFDYEKHAKILGDLTGTPTFVYPTREMYKGGKESSPKEAQKKMPQEPIEIGKDIFSNFSFFEGPNVGQDNGSKTVENVPSKTEESGFLSLSLDDYLDDSADSPIPAGKEKSLFSFVVDSPVGGAKGGFFPLFGADNKDTSKEAKSGFSLNFGGNDNAKSPDDGSSFKFLF